MGTFRWGASQKSWNGDIDLVQLRILRLYHVLGGLEIGGNKLVFEDKVSCSQLLISMYEDLGLEYPR